MRVHVKKKETGIVPLLFSPEERTILLFDIHRVAMLNPTLELVRRSSSMFPMESDAALCRTSIECKRMIPLSLE